MSLYVVLGFRERDLQAIDLFIRKLHFDVYLVIAVKLVWRLQENWN